MTSEQRLAVSNTNLPASTKSLIRGNSVATLNQIYQHHNSIPVRNRILNTAKSLQQASIDLPDADHSKSDQFSSILGFGRVRNSSSQLSATAAIAGAGVGGTCTYTDSPQHLNHLQVSPVHARQQQQQQQQQQTGRHSRSATLTPVVAPSGATGAHSLAATNSSANAHQLIGVQVINVARRHKKRPSSAADTYESQSSSQLSPIQQLPDQSTPNCASSSRAAAAAAAALASAGPLRAPLRTTTTTSSDEENLEEGCPSSELALPERASSPSQSSHPMNRSRSVQQQPQPQQALYDVCSARGLLHAHQRSESRSPSPARSPQDVAERVQQQPLAARRRVLPPPPPSPAVAQQTQQADLRFGQLELDPSIEGREMRPPANWKRHRKLPQIPTRIMGGSMMTAQHLQHQHFTSFVGEQPISNQSTTFSSSMDQQQPLRLQSFPLLAAADKPNHSSVPTPFGQQQQQQPNRPTLARVSSHTGGRLSFSSSSSSNSPASSAGNSYLLTNSRFTFEPPTPNGLGVPTQSVSVGDPQLAFPCPSSPGNYQQFPTSPATQLSASSRTLSPNEGGPEQQDLLGLQNSQLGAGRGRRLSSCGLGSRASFLMNKQRAIGEFTPPRSLELCTSRGSGDILVDVGRCGSAQSIAQPAVSSRTASSRTSYSSQQSPNRALHQAALAADGGGCGLSGGGGGGGGQQLPKGLLAAAGTHGRLSKSGLISVQRLHSGAAPGLPPRAASATETNSRSGGLGDPTLSASCSTRPVPAARSMTTVPIMMMSMSGLLAGYHTSAGAASFNYKQRLAAPSERSPIEAAISIDVYQPDQQQSSVHTSPEVSLGRPANPAVSSSPAASELDQAAGCLAVVDRTGRQSLALPTRDRQPSNASTSSMPAGVGVAKSSASSESGPRKFGAWAERFGSGGRSPERPIGGGGGPATPNAACWSRSASQLGGNLSLASSRPDASGKVAENNSADLSSSSSCARSSSSLSSSSSPSSVTSSATRSSSGASSGPEEEENAVKKHGEPESGEQRTSRRRRKCLRRRGRGRGGPVGSSAAAPLGESDGDQLTLGDKLKLAEKSAQRLFRKVELSPAGSRQLSGSKQNSNESAASPYSLGRGSSFQFSGAASAVLGGSSSQLVGSSNIAPQHQHQHQHHHHQLASTSRWATDASNSNCEREMHEFAHDEQADDLSLFLRSVDKQKFRELRSSGATKLSSSSVWPAQQQQSSKAGVSNEPDRVRPSESAKGVAARAFKRAITLRRLVSSFGRRASSCEPVIVLEQRATTPASVKSAEKPLGRPAPPLGNSRWLAVGKRRSSSADQADASASERASRLHRMRSVITAVSKRLEPLRGMNGSKQSPAHQQDSATDCAESKRKSNANSKQQQQQQQQFSATTRRKLSSLESHQQQQQNHSKQQQWTHLVDRAKA